MRKMINLRILLASLMAVIQIFWSIQSFAAISATTVWNIRKDATAASVNGGGFNTNNANFLTDLAATSATGDSPVVTSASYTFAAGDAGAHVFIKSGTNWKPGWYEIASVNAGAATLKAAVGEASQVVGTVGATYAPIAVANTVAGCASTASPTGGTFGVDYSQQTAAEFALTDLTQVGSSTTLASSAAFTLSMVGNLIHIIDGTNFTQGWYEIVSYTTSSAVVLDRTACSTNASAGVANVGGSVNISTDTTSGDMFAALVAGNGVWVMHNASAFTAGEAITGTAGAATTPIYMYGYLAVRGDNPTGANRPVIDMDTYQFTCTTGYWFISNMIMTGEATEVLELNSYGRLSNSFITNSSATAGGYAVFADSYSVVIDSELVSTNGYCGRGGLGSKYLYTYFHDSATAVIYTSGYFTFHGNIVDTMTTYGLRATAARNNGVATNNTFYGANDADAVAISIGASVGTSILNNIFADWATSITITGPLTQEDYNLFYSNTTDPSQIGVNSVTGTSPWSGDPASGDFSIAAAAKAIGAPSTFNGTSQSNYLDLGAVQSQCVTGGGGGGETSYAF